MRKMMFIALLALCTAAAFGQKKYAVVIGNADYSKAKGEYTFSRLTCPVNDAADMWSALKNDLHWTVYPVITDGNYKKMKDGIDWLKAQLSRSRDSYGFLYYSGHGAQIKGVNYLVPVDANLPNDSSWEGEGRAISVKTVLRELTNIGNTLNIVALDACRTDPTRGGPGAFVGPDSDLPGSIVVYGTSEDDSSWEYKTRRNGEFTTYLLKNLRENLKKPELTVHDVFLQVGADVQKASASTTGQTPALYIQFFGTAYLGEKPQ